MARLGPVGHIVLMTRFRCLPMDASAAARFRATRRDDRGGQIQTRQVDGPGYPCRACLRLGLPGETMLLASWDLPLPQGPYWTPSPVFLHAHDCGGAALEGARIGLADNWLRHIQDVRDLHRDLLEGIAEERRCDALVELNAIEQVVNVAQSTVLQDAWLRGQVVALHGWVYGIHDGLLKDMGITVTGNDSLEAVYKAAIQGVGQAKRL